ncbi:MAG: RNA polymerase sigma factor [Candidatus Omnitrophica bacterium]|nr:RNA polymerase sigma factor [Candidatus Omnitrophota bacterium]
MENLNEKVLVELAKKGNNDAFVSLLKNVENRLYKVAYVISPDEVEDIIQETFLQAYLSIKKFKGISSFYTWIYRIMMNIIYKRNRKKRPLIKNVNIVFQNDEELKEKVREALKKLHPKLNEVITLFYFEEYSIKEISKILNIKEGTVKSRLFKGKKVLKKFLENKK